MKLKYAILIPMPEVMIPQILFEQWMNVQEWISSNNISAKIFPYVGTYHIEARNHLWTNGQTMFDPYKFANEVEWFVNIDADQRFRHDQLIRLLEYDNPFVSGWYLRRAHDPVNTIGYKSYPGYEIIPEEEMYKKTDPFYADWIPGGFFKVHTDIVKQLEYPFWKHDIKYIDELQTSTFLSEDLSLCNMIEKTTKIKPLVLPDLKVGHVKWITI